MSLLPPPVSLLPPPVFLLSMPVSFLPPPVSLPPTPVLPRSCYSLCPLCPPPASPWWGDRNQHANGSEPQWPSFGLVLAAVAPPGFHPLHRMPASPQPARGSSHIFPLQPQPGVPSDVALVAPAGTCWLRGTRSLEQPVVCLDFSSVELGCVTQWRHLNQQRPGGRDRKSRLQERVSRCQGGRSPRFHRPELSIQD